MLFQLSENITTCIISDSTSKNIQCKNFVYRVVQTPSKDLRGELNLLYVSSIVSEKKFFKQYIYNNKLLKNLLYIISKNINCNCHLSTFVTTKLTNDIETYYITVRFLVYTVWMFAVLVSAARTCEFFC